MGREELAVMAVQRSDEKETDKQGEAKILMRKKFHVPTVDPPPPQDLYKDNRNIIEITDNGIGLLREDVLKLMTKWKRLQEVSRKEKEWL